MAIGRQFVGFNVDADQAYALTGWLQELSLQVRTPAYIGPTLRYAHSLMSKEFNLFMDELAGAGDENEYHHVYEWNMIGNADARLWRNVLRGHGNNRLATFEWLPSKTIVPVVHEDAEGVQEKHVFMWKAPVMEYGIPVYIAPKDAERIIYFTGPDRDPGPLRSSAVGIVVSHPGGKRVEGAFTRAFVGWWAAGGAQAVFDTQVRETLENDLGHIPDMKIGVRRRPKTMKMSVMGDASAAIAAGRAAARQYLAGVSTKYGNLSHAMEEDEFDV